MSNSVEVPQHIQQALREFAVKLKPAELNTASTINGPLLSKWLREDGCVINSLSVKELAEALYAVTVKHVHERKLEWIQEPKVLRQHEVEKFERADSNKWTEERNRKMQEIDAAAKKSKEDGKAEQDLTSLIEGLSVTISGRTQYGWNEQGNADLRALANTLRKSMPLPQVVQKVREARNKIYSAAELAGTDLSLPRAYRRPW